MDIGTQVKLEAQGITLFGVLVEQDDLGFTVADSKDGTRYSIAWESLFDGSVSVESVVANEAGHSLRKAA